MKTNSVKILSAVVAGLFVLGTTVYAQGIDSRTSRPVMEGKAIAKPEAEKKYPPPSSGYPTGERDPHDPSGIVASPYPPHQKFNCSKIAFVLDTTANKVFVRP